MMLCCVQLAATSFRTNLYKMGGLCQERLKVVLGFHKPDASAMQRIANDSNQRKAGTNFSKTNRSQIHGTQVLFLGQSNVC